MKKIIVIDDEKDVCYLIHKSLEKTGLYEVYSTSVPEEALDLCLREQPDMVLMDIVMPNMDGRDLIRSLKEDQRTEHARIVVMTGLGEMVYVEKKERWQWLPNRPLVFERGEVIEEKNPEKASEAYGVDDFIPKPFSPATLLSVVEEVFSRENSSGVPQQTTNHSK